MKTGLLLANGNSSSHCHIIISPHHYFVKSLSYHHHLKSISCKQGSLRPRTTTTTLIPEDSRSVTFSGSNYWLRPIDDWSDVVFSNRFSQLPILEAGGEVSGGEGEPRRVPQLAQLLDPLRRDLSPLQGQQHSFPAGAKSTTEKSSFELQRHSDEDKIVSSLLLKWWTNFAKHGNPNGISGDDDDRWTPLTSSPDSKYLEISSEGGQLKKFATFFPELRNFFEEIWAAVPPRMHLPRWFFLGINSQSIWWEVAQSTSKSSCFPQGQELGKTQNFMARCLTKLSMHLPPPPQPPHPPPPPTLPRHPLRRPHPPLPLSHQVREAPLLHRHQNYNSSFYQCQKCSLGEA